MLVNVKIPSAMVSWVLHYLIFLLQIDVKKKHNIVPVKVIGHVPMLEIRLSFSHSTHSVFTPNASVFPLKKTIFKLNANYWTFLIKDISKPPVEFSPLL